MTQSMSANAAKLLSSARCFGGHVQVHYIRSVFTHPANGGLSAKFSVYLPENATASNKAPVVYWLSGLTCTEDNFMQKAGAQQYANELGIALVAPDTSPRTTSELEIPGEHDSYDFGSGAGFYVNATQSPWSKYYQMYDYINCELPSLLRASDLPLDPENASLMGHSMGGHGALISYLRLPALYKSVSAFSPICNPINCRWGQKCFGGYLGTKETSLDEWKKYDATELVQSFSGKTNVEILIDQGADDAFLRDGDDEHNQLLPENFVDASKRAPQNVSVHLRWQPGYDHSYYFIASFIKDHLKFHAEHLKL